MSDQPTTSVTPTPGPRVSELRLVLTVADHDVAVEFYRDRLGLVELEHYEDNEGHVTILDAGRATLELNDAPYAEFIDEVEVGRRIPEQVRIAFQVLDSEDAAARLVESGAHLIAPATRTPWNSRNARVRDPDGMQLTLFTELETPDPTT